MGWSGWRVGPSGITRGKRSENLVLEALAGARRPEWILEARLGGRRADARGVDLIVRTDRGRFGVQVKSNAKAVGAWRERWGAAYGDRVAVVVADRRLSPRDLARAAQGAVYALRERKLLRATFGGRK